MEEKRQPKLPLMQRALTPRNIKYVAISVMILVSVSLSVLGELIKAQFRPDTISSAEFWLQTGLAIFRNITLLIAMLWLAMILSEKSLAELYDKLTSFWRWLINARASKGFSEYLIEVNKSKKIKAFKEMLQRELASKEVTAARKKEIRDILTLTPDELWVGTNAADKPNFEGVEFMNIAYVEVSEAYLFSGLSSKNNSSGERYTPIINTIWRVLPPLMITIVLLMLYYSIIPEFKAATDDIYLLVAVNLLFLVFNGLAGFMIGEYTVCVEKRAFLEYRISVAYGFNGHRLCPAEPKT